MKLIKYFSTFQVIFSQTSELLERQSSMASSTEEVSGTNDVSTDSKQHDTTDTEQKFGVYMREFDFLEYELESLEVRRVFKLIQLYFKMFKDAVFRYNLDSAKIETYFEFLRHFCRATAGRKNGAKIQNKTGFWQNPNCTKKRHL